MTAHFKKYFKEKNLLPDQEQIKIEEYDRNGYFTVKNELRFFLYVGILLFVSGAGILIYKNIDTIGHQAILLTLILICAFAFYWSWKNKAGFEWTEVKHPSVWTDHVVLLACLLFGIIEAYAHLQFGLFGKYYSIGVLLPAFVFIPMAYIYDHRGVLSLGITAFVSWCGIGFSPYDLDYIFSQHTTLFLIKAIGIGIFLAGIAWWKSKNSRKGHFSHTIHNFSVHLIAASALYGLFDWNFPEKLLAIALLAATVWFYFRFAKEEESYYFILVSVLYGYIGLTYLVFSWMDDSDTILFAGMLYMMASSAGIILFFINLKKIITKQK